MASPIATRRQLPKAPIVIGALAVVALIAGLSYLSRPVPKAAEQSPSAESKAYLQHLKLSDVQMKATENFMKQQVVEVEGNISNEGTRPIERVDVYCIFSGINGNEVYREKVPIVASKPNQALGPNQTRSFRLPFDSLPDTWNQAMPRLVIAQIVFAR
jgi:hypothetical protein